MWRVALLLVIGSVLSVARGANAAPARLAPAADGRLGAWLVAGPLSKAAVEKLEPGELEPALGAPAGYARWRLIAAAPGALDLKRTLGVNRKAGPWSLVGGAVDLPKPFEGWLLVSADGAIGIWVDGQRLIERTMRRLRHASWDALPIELGAGRHTLLMALEHPGEHWAFEARLVDAARLLPPAGATLLLPGAADHQAKLADALTVTTLSPGLGEHGYRPTLRIEHPRGMPRDAGRQVRLSAKWLGGDRLFELRAGDVPLGARGVQPFEVRLPALETLPDRPTTLVVEASVGALRRTHRLLVHPKAPAELARARALLKALPPGLLDPEAVAATIEQRIRELGEADSRRKLTDALAALRRFDDLLESGSDPLRRSGILPLALRSALDGQPEALLLHVPKSYPSEKQRRYPLVVALHGYNGSPQGIMHAFLDGSTQRAHPSVDGFVVAPAAYGNSFYRDAGEREVMRVLDWVTDSYPIDENRISVTGVSMGGTGTAYMAFRHADRFAAAAPLCGYHSYFIRRDTSNRPIRPWEQQRMHHWSTTSWAERARHLFVHVAHGTKDYPLQNSKVLIDRLRALGYQVTAEWPETGHHVWDVTYAGARMWPVLTRQRRDPEPSQVSIVTNALRNGSLYWLSVDRLARSGPMARAEAEVTGRHEIVITSEGVAALSARRPEKHVDAAAPLVMKVNGDALEFAAGEPLRAHHTQRGWAKGPGPGDGKRAGLEGPIRDAFLGPVTFVYGSLDESTRRANREVAETLARGHYGIELSYPVVADRDVDSRLQRERHLFLVGTPRDNMVLAKLDAKLPIGARGGAIHLGKRRFAARDVGAIFVYPNPQAPDRYVVVVTAPTLGGIYRALSLPQLLPDFLVYDAGLAAAAGEQVLGKDAYVLAGGFFEPDWSLPERLGDPHAPSR